MMIFAVFAVVAATTLTDTFKVARGNTQRTAAANLAAQQIEAVRAARAVDIPDNSFVVSPAPVVNGTTFTVRQTASYVASGAGQSICSSDTDTLTYKLVTVTVTWPGMGSIKPVRNDTLKTLGLGVDGVDQSKGVAAVLVTGASGLAQAGVNVTLSPSGGTKQTGVDGCAIFAGLTPGSYAAQVNQAGYVGMDGAQMVQTSSAGVLANDVGHYGLSYEPRGALAVTLVPRSGYPAPPTALGVTLSFSGFTPLTKRGFYDCSAVSAAPQNCVSGAPRLASSLYPGRYGAWAGGCRDAAPSSFGLTDVPAGGSASASASLAGLQFQVVERISTPTPPARIVYAIHAADDTCTTGERWNLGSGTGLRLASLPAGVWTLALTTDGSGPPSGGWPSVTLSTGSVPAPVNVNVP